MRGPGTVFWLRVLAVVAIAFGILFFGFGLGPSGPQTLSAVFIGWLLGVLITLSLLSLYQREKAKNNQVANQTTLFGPRRVSIGEGGIECSTQCQQTIYQWPILNRLAVTGQHLVLVMDQALYEAIPLSAFASDTELENFIGQIEKLSGIKRS